MSVDTIIFGRGCLTFGPMISSCLCPVKVQFVGSGFDFQASDRCQVNATSQQHTLASGKDTCPLPEAQTHQTKCRIHFVIICFLFLVYRMMPTLPFLCSCVSNILLSMYQLYFLWTCPRQVNEDAANTGLINIM